MPTRPLEAPPGAPEAAPPREGIVTAVLSGSGGVGKSTLVANLAVAMAAHAQVALVDLSLEFPDLGVFLDLTSPDNIAHLARDADVSDDSRRPLIDPQALAESMVVHPTGVRVLLGPARPVDAGWVHPNHVLAILEHLRGAADHVLLDMPPRIDHLTLPTLRAADRVVLVTGLTRPALRAAQGTLDVLTGRLIASQIVVVANRCDAVGSIDPSLAQAMLGAHLDHLIPYAAKLTDLAEIKGVPFVISDPKSEPARRITELARSLLSAPAPVQ